MMTSGSPHHLAEDLCEMEVPLSNSALLLNDPGLSFCICKVKMPILTFQHFMRTK